MTQRHAKHSMNKLSGAYMWLFVLAEKPKESFRTPYYAI